MTYRHAPMTRGAVLPQAHGGQPIVFGTPQWRTLGWLYGVIVILHIAGWGLYLRYCAGHPSFVGLGLAAYLFGLRHAFDADHIAAIDDTVRFLLQRKKTPLAVGFFFSLGHSTVVFVLAVAIALASTAMKSALPDLRTVGAVIGATVSGTFLWIIGILNLAVLLDMLKLWRGAKAGVHTHEHVDELIAKRGLMSRLFNGRLERIVQHSWQMYPLGVLFGLGFDTASEISLLAMTAGASAGDIPLLAVLALPLLFAAGMSVMDTTDGVLMVKAYNWAFVNPLRRIFYNLTITGLSIGMALVIGTIELLQVAVNVLRLRGAVFAFIAEIDFSVLGYFIVAVFAVAWCASAMIWKIGKIDVRAPADVDVVHVHSHAHRSGVVHSHRHIH